MYKPKILVLTSIFSSLVFQSIVAVAAAAAAAKAKSTFSVDLVHRDSPLSPFYNSSLTSSQILRKNALHSMDRIKAFQAMIDQNKDKNIHSVVKPYEGAYLMKLAVGTPQPVELFAVADTGSDLVWFKCSNSPFNPQQSSSYQKLSCRSEPCQSLTQSERQCLNLLGLGGDCQYTLNYGLGENTRTSTEGVLSTDTLSFNSDSGSTAFPASVFGCGLNNQGNFPGDGLVGLGGGPLSLVSQLGDQIDHRFSYCLVPHSSQSSTSKLNFGKEAIISQPGAVSTPLVPVSVPTFYVLSLEGVSIGGNTVQPSSNNIIIDSGTTLTILEPNFYSSLESMVKGAIVGSEPVQDPNGGYSLCYAAETKIPEMVFHFKGADLRLQPVNTFRPIDEGLICMLIVPNTDDNSDISLFGNYAQINFLVEYDLQKKTVSFAPTDCTKQ